MSPHLFTWWFSALMTNEIVLFDPWMVSPMTLFVGRRSNASTSNWPLHYWRSSAAKTTERYTFHLELLSSIKLTSTYPSKSSGLAQSLEYVFFVLSWSDRILILRSSLTPTSPRILNGAFRKRLCACWPSSANFIETHALDNTRSSVTVDRS